MGRELHDSFASSRAVFDEVSEAIGRDVRAVCFELDEDTLRQTQNAQIALYVCGVAAYAAFREAGGAQPDFAAGHSIGEYAALAAAEIVTVADGARLVALRGSLMAESGRERPGGMAAVLGLERERLEEVCREASTADEVAVVANDNCPGQLVVSGDKAAVERACVLATEAGAKRAIPLNVSGAFHSPLMEQAALRMGEALRAVAFRTGNGTKVVGNVEADANEDPSRWPDLLEAQLRQPVRWTESVRRMRRLGAAVFVEFGPGDVLTGLLRRIDREARGLRAFDPESVAQAVAELKA